jgi:hypothetical protein
MEVGEGWEEGEEGTPAGIPQTRLVRSAEPSLVPSTLSTSLAPSHFSLNFKVPTTCHAQKILVPSKFTLRAVVMRGGACKR